MRARSTLLLLLLFACGNPAFEPPEAPIHDVEEDGALHGRRYENPFNCGPNDRDEEGNACPTVRPPDEQLSCDATGCHGNYDFEDSPPNLERKLFGSDGPSCYTCHGEKWEDD
ncbi:MAG: hypothetical protein RIT81_24680 [Deltaproteobacteria bacterium]